MATLLESSAFVDLQQLCIDPGRAAWAVYVDIYVLDADGSLHDVCLLAMAAALSTLTLQPAVVDEAGNVVRPEQVNGSSNGATQQAQQRQRLQLGPLPVSLTCGLYGDKVIVDLTADEEKRVDSSVVTTVDATGDILGTVSVWKGWPCLAWS